MTLLYAAKWLFSILLIVVIGFRIDFGLLLVTLTRIPWWSFPVGLFLAIMSQILATLKWQIFLPNGSFKRLFELNLISQFYQFLLPSSLTGDFTRALKINGLYEDLEDAHSSIIVDRVTGVFSLISLLTICALLTDSHQVGLLFLTSVGTLVSIACFSIILGHRLKLKLRSGNTSTTLDWLSQKRLVGRLINVIPISIAKLDSTKTFRGTLLGIVFQLAMTLFLFMCFKSSNIEVSIVDCLIMNLTSQIASLVPIGIGGIGIRDLSIVGVAELLGYPTAAIWAGVIVGYPVILTIVIAGYIFDVRWNKS